MSKHDLSITQSNTWMNAREIASLKLSDFPHTERGVQIRLEPNETPEIFVRKRSGRGGGHEFHYFALSLEGIVDFECRFSPPRPALDALALRDGATFIETAEGGKLFAFIRREHVIDPSASAAIIRKRSIEQFGNYVNAVEIETGLLKRMPMPSLTAFRRILSDVRSYYALGATTRRVGFDRVFDRFARSKLSVSIGEEAVIQLEEQIRTLMNPTFKTKQYLGATAV